MKLLAIDCSTNFCSLALSTADKLITQCQYAPMQHASIVHKLLDRVLAAANLRVADLDGLVLSVGPGSFTGVRIATSVVQAFAVAYDLPVALISTLDLIAQGFAYYQPNYCGPVCVIQDARMGELYVSKYNIMQQQLQKTHVDSLIRPLEFNLILTDDTVTVLSTNVQAVLALLAAKQVKAVQIIPHAQYLLPLAQKKFCAGEVVSAIEVAPVYLRSAIA